MKYKHFLMLAPACFLISSMAYAAESHKQDTQTSHHSSGPGSSSSFICERISGLYYSTAVTGYDSDILAVSEFLNQKFKEGWSPGKVKFNKEPLPSPNDRAYEWYDPILKTKLERSKSTGHLSANISENDFELIEHRLTYKYLYKQQPDKISIVFLIVCSDIIFGLKNRNLNRTFDKLMEERERRFQLHNDFQPQRMAALQSILQAENDIISLTYSPVKNENTDKLIDVLKSTKRLAEEELKKVATEQEECFVVIHNINEELKNYVQSTDYHTPFDLSTKRIGAIYDQEIMKHLQTTFPRKLLEIHTLIESEEDISSSLLKRLLSLTSYSGASTIGHLCYGKVIINPRQSSLDVMLIDTTFDTEQPYLRPVFGSQVPLPQQSRSLFTKLAGSLRLTLNHTYHYRGDQVFNFHDCGRFSTIYLLAELEGKSALSLSNHDIYKGFKALQADDFDLLQQIMSLNNPQSVIPTRFSRFIGGSRRFACDLVLEMMYAETPFFYQIFEATQ